MKRPVLLSTILAIVASQPSSWLPRIAANNFLYAPDDAKVPQNALPILSNGFLATQFMSSDLFASLLFNGYSTIDPSHRARIPATLALSIEGATPCDGGLDLLNATFYRRSFLDPSPPGSCTLQSTSTCSNAPSRLFIEQRFYAHRVLPSVLVHEIELLTQNDSSESSNDVPLAMLQLANNGGDASSDISFTAIALPYGFPYWILNGSTNVAETNSSGLQAVAVLTSFLGSPNSSEPSSMLAFGSYGSTAVHFTVVRTSVETVPEDLVSAVQDDFDTAMTLFNNGTLHSSHIAEWQEMVWSSGIEIGGRADVARIYNSSIYAIVSSLSADRAGGLAPSGLTAGYNGHSFWDTETWQMPTIRLLFPDLAASLIEYRFNRLAGAQEKAKSYSPPYSGAMWPWESALTGVETCPTSSATGLREIHISGDIPMALYDHWRSIEDNGNGWLAETGWPMLSQTAAFWMSKLALDNPGASKSSPLNINDVIPPDEYADHKNNSVWTNLGAILTLRYAAAAAQQLGKPESVWGPWLDAAGRIVVLYNATSPSGARGGFHPEYQGYDASAEIKQADVVIVPLVKSLPELQQQLQTQNVSFDLQSIANDLDWYATVTDPDGPAMTWGVFAGGYALLGDQKSANAYYNRSFQTVDGPYAVWFEVPGGRGTAGFLTGAGGFLQTPSYFSGLHINDTSLSLSAAPMLPEGATYFKLRGVSYLGNRLDVSWDAKQITIALQEAPASRDGAVVASQRGQVLLKGRYRVKSQDLVVVDALGRVSPLLPGGVPVAIPLLPSPVGQDERVVIRRA